MDYAENWQVKYMEEIGSVYYDKVQISIHPVVLHYRDEDGAMKDLSYVGLSCVMAHSGPTTFAFLKAVLLELHHIMPFLNTIHFVTDSPSSQYRNRSICALVGRFPSLFSVRASWAWLEAGHGKGPCDGVGGSVKKKADNLVKSGHIMKNCAELCTTLRSVQTQFNILQVLEEDVARCQKKVESWSPNAMNGLLEAHAIVPMDNTLMMRDTSCYHDCCYEGGGVFHPHCDGWRIVPVAVIRDQLDEEKNSSNGRRYNLRQ